MRARPTELGQPEDSDEDPWDALDPHEHEGPSCGKAKASHPTPPEAASAPVHQEEETPQQAAVEGEPLDENDLPGTKYPRNCKGHVEKYRYMLDEDINGKVVEHVTVDGHPFELITKSGWEMEGADRLRFPQRLYDHRTKVNAVTRGQPGQDVSLFNDEMWLDLDDFFNMYNRMLPKKVAPPSVGELMALLWHDNKARFEFQCVAGHQTATRKGLAYWPFKIRAVQGHSKRAISTAAASDTFNATAIYADSGAAALKKVSATGKTIITPEETPGVIYHKTTRGNWKGILDSGFIPGGGDRVSSGRAHSYFSEARVEEGKYVSGLRADCPVEIRVAMQEAVRYGVVFIHRKES